MKKEYNFKLKLQYLTAIIGAVLASIFVPIIYALAVKFDYYPIKWFFDSIMFLFYWTIFPFPILGGIIGFLIGFFIVKLKK